ncbi:UNVERIFIED_CONTAM: hypothetical protein Sindi_0287900 [Sesamum indicum]
MALSPLRSKAFDHGRSLSLPSGSHPAMSQYCPELELLRPPVYHSQLKISFPRQNKMFKSYFLLKEKGCAGCQLLSHIQKKVKEDDPKVLENAEEFQNGTKEQARQSGWSLVSKLPSKKVLHQCEETDTNEFKKVDTFLQMSQEDETQVKELMNHSKEMYSSIQSLEEELELLFRQLIKTRVFLLNILPLELNL